MKTEIEKLNDAETPEEWQAIVEAEGGSLDYCCDGSPAPNVPDWADEADAQIEVEGREQHETNEDGTRSAFVPINIEFLGVTWQTGAWLTIDSNGEIIDSDDDYYAPRYPIDWTTLADHAQIQWEKDKAEAISEEF